MNSSAPREIPRKCLHQKTDLWAHRAALSVCVLTLKAELLLPDDGPHSAQLAQHAHSFPHSVHAPSHSVFSLCVRCCCFVTIVKPVAFGRVDGLNDNSAPCEKRKCFSPQVNPLLPSYDTDHGSVRGTDRNGS